MVAIEVPADYGYVLLSLVSTLLTGTYLGIRVGGFRKAAGIPYPFEYASYEQVHSPSTTPERKAALLKFNAAQRGHQNFLENHFSVAASLAICGLSQPKLTAALGAVWSVNRVLYSVGYTNWNQNGKGRYAGVLGLPIQYGVQIWAAVVAWKMI
ncbi:hypothetical protein BU23DRAFT_480123 [Bimuria novae-zelandiae CBS 107.79]|uniref:Membrane-associated proteins in eicosanoid and glutathione metabolism n=1 Tax=Bimuria novae-zelandiae CBS 107.79 TaxID=1447943 RepID=A0A6A5UVI9_9PLEO|nr:hypothetical protein BU23DRAFT_480123 [Bimuria novae-zelandiae CBS 107.79]